MLHKVRTNKPLSFRDYVDRVHPRYTWSSFHIHLADTLQLLADGTVKRLLVTVPPRHGKTVLVSQLFASYWIYRYPQKWVALTSHSASLAQEFSSYTRDYYGAIGGAMRDDMDAKGLRVTPQGGGMWAAGIGGSGVGRGWDLGIIDDPIKDAAEADSEVIRRRNESWYDQTWQTRRHPNAAEIVVMQRWAEDDLVGYILGKCDNEDGGEPWHVAHYEAVKEEAPPKYPASCVLLPDWREVGETLWPDKYGRDFFDKRQRAMTARGYSAMYQQRPIPGKGTMFQRGWFDVPIEAEAVPDKMTVVRYWDKAGTEGGTGAETAGVLVGRKNGMYYILDIIHDRWSTHNRELTIAQTAALDAAKYRDYWIWVEQEPGSGGKESAEATMRNLGKYAVGVDRVTGDKVMRARPLSGQAEAGNVKLVKADWNEAFLKQAEAFPYAKIKDMIDAASGAYNKLQEIL